jgi:hypothetical protein
VLALPACSSEDATECEATMSESACKAAGCVATYARVDCADEENYAGCIASGPDADPCGGLETCARLEGSTAEYQFKDTCIPDSYTELESCGACP